MRFTIVIERDEDGVFVAECAQIPGCVSQGRTESEAVANVEDAIRECIEVRAERRVPLTARTRDVEIPVP